MALTEQRVLKQITVLPEPKTVNVQWSDQVLRDGTVITETLHRKAYSEKQKNEFLAEVEGSEKYVAAVGW